MGAQQSLFAVGGAVGPALAGVLLQLTHSYAPTEIVTTTAFLVAAATIAFNEPTRRNSEHRGLVG